MTPSLRASLAIGVSAAFLWSSAAADPIDDARLLAARDDAANWLTYGHDYSNQRFSKLKQIDRDSVGGLALAWEFRTGVKGPFQTQPLVADGMMVITTPHNHVIALDAATGAELWRYEHVKRIEQTRSGPSNRGPAIGYGKVYQATNDGRLIALDRATGAIAWDSLLATPAPGEVEALSDPDMQQAFIASVDAFPAKMPPLVAGGKVIAGVISAGYGLYQDLASEIGVGATPDATDMAARRGYLAAFDAETGAELWRWHTTKADGWEGDFVATTPDGEPLHHRDIEAEKAAAPEAGDIWRRGGGSTWMTPSYDPDLGLIYVGTGNPSPADADHLRPGDNLYTSSVVALEIETGAVRWYYQVVPHDIWGYDVASPPMLFNVPTGYGATPAVGVAAKTGWFYALDRETGTLLFRSEALVPQSNLFARGTPEGVTYAPGSFGGTTWSPSAHHPGLGLIFVPAIHRPATIFEATFTDDTTGEAVSFMRTEYDEAGEQWGTLSAISTRRAGAIEWQVKTDQPLVSGILATAGGLVFVGEGGGRFSALDAQSGESLWHYDSASGINAPAMTYDVDGVQYVAVASGGSRFFGFPPGDSVLAFALPGS